MDTYDPLTAPDPGAWLALDEDARIELVIGQHRKDGETSPNERLHATMHAIVENQIALGDEVPTGATLDRLVAEGLDRHEAIHAIAGVLIEFLQDLTGGEGSVPFDTARFQQELDKLNAADWRESFT